jgi:hypothetical protein
MVTLTDALIYIDIPGILLLSSELHLFFNTRQNCEFNLCGDVLSFHDDCFLNILNFFTVARLRQAIQRICLVFRSHIRLQASLVSYHLTNMLR